jgi:hypothetical protein
MSNAEDVDFSLYNHGSIVALVPRTQAAKDWCSDHIPEDAAWFGHGVAIEPRYVHDIVEGLQADGLTLG